MRMKLTGPWCILGGQDRGGLRVKGKECMVEVKGHGTEKHVQLDAEIMLILRKPKPILS